MRRAVTIVLIVSVLLVLEPPTRALASTGYHYTGAQSTARYDGAYAWIEATDPSARANTVDFNANRIMAKNSTSTKWIEVGWAETGWKLVSGVPEQYVYVYDTVSQDWHFYDALAGGHIDVRIVKSSSCNIGDPTCIYIAQIWNHSSGAWENLRSASLPMDRMYVEEFTEVYEDPAQAAAHMEIDRAANDLDWFETDRRYADGSWRLWNTDNTTPGNSTSTYCTDWITPHSRFETFKGAC